MAHQNSRPPGGGGMPQLSPDMASMMSQFAPGQKNQQGQAAGSTAANTTQPQKPARPIGSPLQEAKYFAQDVATGLTDVLPDAVQEVLGMQLNDPQQQARRKQMLEKYNQLTDQDKAYADRLLAQEKQKKEQEEIARQQREKQKAQEKQQSAPTVPAGKKSGMMHGQGGNSNKKATTDWLNQQRQQLSNSG